MDFLRSSLVSVTVALAAAACDAAVLVGSGNGTGGAGGAGTTNHSATTGATTTIPMATGANVATVAAAVTGGGVGCTVDPGHPVACGSDPECAPLGGSCNNAGVCVCGASPSGELYVLSYGSDPVRIRFTNFPITCDDPDKPMPGDVCSSFSVDLSVSASLFAPGPLEVQGAPNVSLVWSFTGPVANPDSCSGTGGSGGPGTGGWNIVSIDPSSLVLSVTNFSAILVGDINGMHTVQRCL